MTEVHYPEDDGRIPVSLADALLLIETLRRQLADRPVVEITQTAGCCMESTLLRSTQVGSEYKVTMRLDNGVQYIFKSLYLTEAPEYVV